MHMPPPSAEETARAIELGHEPSTVSIKGLAWFFVYFFTFGAMVHVLIWIMYTQMVKYEEAQNVPRSALTTSVRPPPEPRLQPTKDAHERTEPEDLAVMRGRENLEFVRRGWIDRETGQFRIPENVVSEVAKLGTTAR